MPSGIPVAEGDDDNILERICRENLDVYRRAPTRLAEDVSQEAQVANDYRGRLVYELLQNADDAMLDSGRTEDRVTFLIDPNALWVANTGRPLTPDDVRGLCGLGASTKVDAAGVKRASIGHKGLGFKAVLEITDRPSVHSSSYSFELCAGNARDRLRSLWPGSKARGQEPAVPVMRFPVAISDEDPTWLRLRDGGYQTAFRFPFRESLDDEERASLGRKLLELPITSVLFLKHLEHLSVIDHTQGRSESRSWSLKRWFLPGDGKGRRCSSYGETGVYRVEVADGHGPDPLHFFVAHDGDVSIGPHRDGLAGPAWRGVERTEVSVAIRSPEDTDVTIPASWRYFHLFLPTEEPCPYPMMVNGAFSSNLSRQHVRVTAAANDYNAHLIREAARVFREHLVPRLLAHGPDAVLRALDRGGPPEPGSRLSAAQVLHEALCAELVDVPLLPTKTGEHLSLPASVLPPSVLGDAGPAFRRLLRPDAGWQGSRFPDAEYCHGRMSRIAADHGARELEIPEAVEALASLADPQRARLRPHANYPLQVDPVLDVLEQLWHRAPSHDHEDLQERVRASALFPAHRHEDGTVDRIALDGLTPYYPPQSAARDLPLARLAFLCHDVCWGGLARAQRAPVLGKKMEVWTNLFAVQEFRFDEVMRNSVLPALALTPDEHAAGMRSSLERVEALAAICQLAGNRTKPDTPLRYERLGSERALFSLSRLPVPCRAADGTLRWAPTYRVYFGSDWIGEASIERILDTLPSPPPADASDEPPSRWRPPDVLLLAPPDVFRGLLTQFDHLEDEGDAEATTDDGRLDEVDLDDDPDRPLEADEHERWVAFLSWVGVNACLRPIDFQDVDDQVAGWLTTRHLQNPMGWAFGQLGPEWDEIVSEARQRASARPEHAESDLYFYKVRRLEHAQSIAYAASQDRSGEIGRRLLEHLERHWSFLQRFRTASIAMIRSSSAPGRRSVPRPKSDEIIEVGDDLWVRELRDLAFCPTSVGPRKPRDAWVPSQEMTRRFGRGGNRPGNFLPILEIDPISRELASSLHLRQDINPSTFTISDAAGVLGRIQALYDGHAVGSRYLRRINPIYREVFELLAGRTAEEHDPPLAGAPLLARTGVDRYEFRPANEILYSRTAGAMERARLASSDIPTFVIQAEASANGPLRTLFGVRELESVLDRRPTPGSPALVDDDLDEFRIELRRIARVLLARLRIERSSQAPTDLVRLRRFVERVIPVESLDVALSIDGETIAVAEPPTYYLERDRGAQLAEAYVLWSSSPREPLPEHAQALAMAIAELLEVNLVETFLTFIESSPDRRLRLLELAGGSQYLQSIDLDEVEEVHAEDEPERAIEPTTADPAFDPPSWPDPNPPPRRPAPVRVPLVSFDDLTFDGEPLRVFGAASESAGDASGKGQDGEGGDHPNSETNPNAHPRAAPGVDIQALDRLGMRIAMAYEVRRLRRSGEADAAAFDRNSPGPGQSVVYDVSTPASIEAALAVDDLFRRVMESLRQSGISSRHPGFDILTVRDGQLDRLIELKSSALDAHVHAMTWNEWKSAARNELRERYWLYLAASLRADAPRQVPYLRAIRDPFGTLMSRPVTEVTHRRAVQLRVREFEEAEHLDLLGR